MALVLPHRHRQQRHRRSHFSSRCPAGVPPPLVRDGREIVVDLALVVTVSAVVVGSRRTPKDAEGVAACGFAKLVSLELVELAVVMMPPAMAAGLVGVAQAAAAGGADADVAGAPISALATRSPTCAIVEACSVVTMIAAGGVSGIGAAILPLRRPTGYVGYGRRPRRQRELLSLLLSLLSLLLLLLSLLLLLLLVNSIIVPSPHAQAATQRPN